MQYIKCEICNESGFEGLITIGHRATHLCREHINAYHRFVIENHKELYEDFCTTKVAISVAIMAKDSEIAMRLTKELIAVEDTFYPISDQWIENQKRA